MDHDDDTQRERTYAWQAIEEGRPGVAEVLSALPPWSETTIAAWFLGPQPELDGMSAVAWLGEGRDAGRVVDAARRDAARWGRP